ncbi:MAG: glycoside hydrolase family 99-like domain-containing protein [Desulfuromonadaceae bacterium]|nr:glycoside hydrolase family 99-like domain-containing protein [Desulfuromonadaceae bacterium]
MLRANKCIKILTLLTVVTITCLCTVLLESSYAQEYKIGVYYFPGWNSKNEFWPDLKGLPGSRSPGKAWTDREPSRGFGYAEESLQIAEQNIEWASSYGIDFFTYDWYWDGKKTSLNHAIDNHLKASNKKKLKFCMLWANHYKVPESMDQFTTMVQYWIDNYFKDAQYLTIDRKPVVVIFSIERLRDNAKTFGKTTKELFDIARNMAVKQGVPGIYFVACYGANNYGLNTFLPKNGYDAMTAYNYQSSGFKGEFTGNVPLSNSYQELLEGYKSQWSYILQNSKLPYILPMSTGWDRRPWGGSKPPSHDNSGSTPESFKAMLTEGKNTIDANPSKTMRMAIIYAWNEFGEGGYIEPTKKWGFKYLQAIKDVFGK